MERRLKPLKRWKDADLREAFDLFNSRYFGGKLAVFSIQFARISGLGLTSPCVFRTISHPRERGKGVRCEIERVSFRIFIKESQRYSRRQWAMTLLHEMVHVEQECRYSCEINGHRFNRRMKQLAAQGAFNGIW